MFYRQRLPSCYLRVTPRVTDTGCIFGVNFAATVIGYLPVAFVLPFVLPIPVVYLVLTLLLPSSVTFLLPSCYLPVTDTGRIFGVNFVATVIGYLPVTFVLPFVLPIPVIPLLLTLLLPSSVTSLLPPCYLRVTLRVTDTGYIFGATLGVTTTGYRPATLVIPFVLPIPVIVLPLMLPSSATSLLPPCYPPCYRYR